LPRFVNRFAQLRSNSRPHRTAQFSGMSNRNQMTTTAAVDCAGFARLTERDWARQRNRALAELITTAALTVCLVIAMVAVSIGITRASTSGAHVEIGRVL
jgi:hypothetical protein